MFSTLFILSCSDDPSDDGNGGDADTDTDSDTGTDPCAPLAAHADWELCESAATSCGGIFYDGAGCDAFCAAVGLQCHRVFGNGQGSCAKEDWNEFPCAPGTGHDSDYCECTGGGDADADVDADTDADTDVDIELPFDYTRPDEGTPISDAELRDFTDRYLELLDGVRYFDFLGERLHGWPQSDPQHRYWYGTW